MTGFIPQMEPMITDADVSAVCDYMRSGGWLTEFEQTRSFEQQLESFTGSMRRGKLSFKRSDSRSIRLEILGASPIEGASEEAGIQVLEMPEQSLDLNLS